MGNMSIRNIDDASFHALKIRAAKNGRSAEAEVRAMIDEIAVSETSGGFGTRLRRCFEGIEGEELDIKRDQAPALPELFE